MNKVSSVKKKKTSTNISGNRSAFFVELKLDNKTHKTNGNDILEAINKLEINLIKCAGLLSAKSGKEKAEIVLYPHQIRRLIVNNTYREILAKRLKLALK